MGNTFFERYDALCREHNETPNSVAKIIGSSSGSVTAWKNGTEPRYKTLLKLADFFGVTVDYLIKGHMKDMDTHINGIHIYTLASGTTDSILENLEQGTYRIVRQSADFLVIVDNDSPATAIEISSAIKFHNASLAKAKEIPPVLTEKDKRDIARDLEAMMEQLEAGGDMMFDGNPMSDEARESIRNALQMGLEIAKVKNKERFTPKKYRKG